MESIGDRLIWYYVPFTDIVIPFGGINVITVLNTLIVMGVLWALFWLGSRKHALVPGRAQVAVEAFVGAFDNLVSSSLELETTEKNRRFFPLVASLFVFLLVCNFMGFWPTTLFQEPTADINTTLSLGIMGMAIAGAAADTPNFSSSSFTSSESSRTDMLSIAEMISSLVIFFSSAIANFLLV